MKRIPLVMTIVYVVITFIVVAGVGQYGWLWEPMLLLLALLGAVCVWSQDLSLPSK